MQNAVLARASRQSAVLPWRIGYSGVPLTGLFPTEAVSELVDFFGCLSFCHPFDWCVDAGLFAQGGEIGRLSAGDGIIARNPVFRVFLGVGSGMLVELGIMKLVVHVILHRSYYVPINGRLKGSRELPKKIARHRLSRLYRAACRCRACQKPWRSCAGQRIACPDRRAAGRFHVTSPDGVYHRHRIRPFLTNYLGATVQAGYTFGSHSETIGENPSSDPPKPDAIRQVRLDRRGRSGDRQS